MCHFLPGPAFFIDFFLFSPKSHSPSTSFLFLACLHAGLIAADGTRRYIANSAAPIRDRQDDITGAVMIIRDMTCENATRDRIYRQKELLENASTTIKIVYFCCSCDKERIVLSRIEYNGEIWGKDAAGKPLPEDQWISPEDYPDYQESWRKILAGEVKTQSMIYRAGSPPGRTFEMRLKRVRNAIHEQFEIVGKTDGELSFASASIDNCRNSDLATMANGFSDGNEIVTVNRQNYTLRCIRMRHGGTGRTISGGSAKATRSVGG